MSTFKFFFSSSFLTLLVDTVFAMTDWKVWYHQGRGLKLIYYLARMIAWMEGIAGKKAICWQLSPPANKSNAKQYAYLRDSSKYQDILAAHWRQTLATHYQVEKCLHLNS